MMKYIQITDRDIFEDGMIANYNYTFMIGVEEDKYEYLKKELEQIIDNVHGEDGDIYEGEGLKAMTEAANKYNGVVINPDCELYW